jgi:hypothetical protein
MRDWLTWHIATAQGPNPMSGSVIRIEAIDELLTQCITTHGSEDLWILGDSADHRRSAEDCGEGPGWGPFFLGADVALQDDGEDSPVSDHRLW